MTHPSNKTWPGRSLFPGKKRKGKPPKGNVIIRAAKAIKDTLWEMKIQGKL